MLLLKKRLNLVVLSAAAIFVVLFVSLFERVLRPLHNREQTETYSKTGGAPTIDKYHANVFPDTKSGVVPLAKVIRFNREYEKKTLVWIDEKYFTKGKTIYKYGTGSRRKYVNLPVGDEVTLTDVIAWFLHTVSTLIGDKPITYLEVGVSFGKTLATIENYVKNNVGTEARRTDMLALDIENIYPILFERLGGKQHLTKIKSFNTPTSSSRFKIHNKHGLEATQSALFRKVTPVHVLNFLVGDVTDPQMWDIVGQHRYINVLFSDAMHEYYHVLQEWRYIKSKELFHPEHYFVFLHDDLSPFEYCNESDTRTIENGEFAKHLASAWAEIVHDKYWADSGFDTIRAHKFYVNGWLGVNAIAENDKYRHCVSVITNLPADVMGNFFEELQQNQEKYGEYV